MEKKMSYLSFAEEASQVQSEILKCLRQTKQKFAQCGENCYEQQSVLLSEWEKTRQKCLNICGEAHDRIFYRMDQYEQIVSSARKCVIRCSSEYPISKFGEEDMNICTEKCYEKLESKFVDILQEIRQEYTSIYLEKC